MYSDYAPKGVQFYYLYKALAHPEYNGYLQPFTLAERLLHIAEARRTLGTRFNWICDAMDNRIKHALGGAPNLELVIDPQGRIVRKRNWSSPAKLRSDLETLVGPVVKTTPADEHKFPAKPPDRPAASGVLEPIEVPAQLQPVKTTPKPGPDGMPFYAKLRAEVEPQLLQTGTGRMYLGFHMDPIHHVHWNNLAAPLRFELNPPAGTTVKPASGTAPKLEVPADIDPREFLVTVENGSQTEPIELTVHYFACHNTEGWCVAFKQQYAITLQRDPDGGGVFGRSFRRGGRRPGRFGAGRGSVNFAERLTRRMMEHDGNGDGKVSRAEAPARMRDRFDLIDKDGDGYIDKQEIAGFARQRGRGSAAGR